MTSLSVIFSNDSYEPFPTMNQSQPVLQLGDQSTSSTDHRSEYANVKKPGRKKHTKSRTGCLGCKRARIKVCRDSSACRAERLTQYSARRTARLVIIVPIGA